MDARPPFPCPRPRSPPTPTRWRPADLAVLPSWRRVEGRERCRTRRRSLMSLVREVVWVFSDVHATEDQRSRRAERRTDLPSDINTAAAPLEAWAHRLATAQRQLVEAELRPDWIYCAGDLATHNQASEIPKSLAFLRKIADNFGVPTQRVVVVPGNHDVEFASANAGKGTDLFYKLVTDAEFTHPRTENISRYSEKGSVPYAVDTTALIGRTRLAAEIKSKLPWWVRFVLPKIEGKIEESLRIEAALILPQDFEVRLASFVRACREQLHDNFFPIAVSHHPLSQPPGKTADTSTDDLTIHSPLLKQRLIEDGVSIIIQGHRHDSVIHTERIVSSTSLSSTPLVVISMPSLGYQDQFLLLEILHTPGFGAHQVVGYFVGPEDYHSPRRPRPDLFETLVQAGRGRCREIRRVLYIDKTGRSRIDHYFFEVAGSAKFSIPLTLSTHGGAFVAEPGHKVLSYYGNATPISRIEGEKLVPGVESANIALILEGASHLEKPTAWLRVQAVRCHATSEQEAVLMRPGAAKFEATAFTIPLATDHYELVIRFPDESLVPKSEQDFHVFAAAPESFKDIGPAEWASLDAPGHIRHLVSVEGARISIATEAKRVFIGIRKPLPGLTYVVRWKLPSVEPRSSDVEFFGVATNLKLTDLLRGPALYSWREVGAASGKLDQLKGRGSLDGVSGIVQRSIAVLALRLRELDGFGELADQDALEVALLGGPYNYGISHEQHRRKPAWVRVLGAVVPDETKGWRRYSKKFGYGIGLAGLAFRTGLMFTYDSRYRPPGCAPNVYCDSADGNRAHQYLVCVPIHFIHEQASQRIDSLRPCAVLSIGMYGGRVPEMLRHEGKLVPLVDELCQLANQYFTRESLPGLRLGISTSLRG